MSDNRPFRAARRKGRSRTVSDMRVFARDLVICAAWWTEHCLVSILEKECPILGQDAQARCGECRSVIGIGRNPDWTFMTPRENRGMLKSMTRNPAVVVLAAIYVYFTLEFLSINTGNPNRGEGFVQRWLIAILVVNVVVLLFRTVRSVFTTEDRPVTSHFRPLSETLVFSILVVPYFFVLYWISYMFLWEF